MREALWLFDVERLVTHRFPLDRLGDAFEAARTRPPGFVKAVVLA
jgi:threonine dehydrogenase-like Zn-dependent dehydrogenase